MSSLEYAIYQGVIFPRIRKYFNLTVLYFLGFPMFSIPIKYI